MSKNILVSPDAAQRYLTIREAAVVLGASRQTLWRRIRMGVVTPLTVDGRYVIPVHLLELLQADPQVPARSYAHHARGAEKSPGQ